MLFNFPAKKEQGKFLQYHIHWTFVNKEMNCMSLLHYIL